MLKSLTSDYIKRVYFKKVKKIKQEWNPKLLKPQTLKIEMVKMWRH